MDKNFLQKKLDDIYARQNYLTENQIELLGRSGFDLYSKEWQELLNRATDLLEKCIREGVRDED